ncbi:MAG: GIY-YIG nuclease family protein [Candidatus Kerfeldbacteria bacterium]
MKKHYYVYIMTNKWNTVLYTGMTGNIVQRIEEHAAGTMPGFTKRYHVNKVVFIAEYDTPTEAAEQERRIKGWTRKRKIALVESVNPHWKDLVHEGDPSLRSGLRMSSDVSRDSSQTSP